ncbi:helix-turn-helix domain-containing protein [Peribacillus frigoritolerans]|uniref:helix-turn-helix domain-containing protein n=1 Tax=Peribacillus frigoritolerans TaxID=450367 RepID=UPI0033067E1F
MSDLPKSIIQEKTESFIMFPKILLHEHDYEGRDLDICHLAIIKSLANNFTKTAITSINDLMTVMGINPKNKEASQKARESIIRLQAMYYITVYADRPKTKTVTDLKPAQTYFIKPTKENEDYFVKVFETDIEIIVTMQSKHKSKLFIIYMAIVSHLYYYHDASMEHKSVWATIETLAEITGLDRRTVMKYIKLLHEAEVLFCITTKVHAKKNKNFYGRYKHKEMITREAMQGTETLQNCKFEDIKPVVGGV